MEQLPLLTAGLGVIALGAIGAAVALFLAVGLLVLLLHVVNAVIFLFLWLIISIIDLSDLAMRKLRHK